MTLSGRESQSQVVCIDEVWTQNARCCDLIQRFKNLSLNRRFSVTASITNDAEPKRQVCGCMMRSLLRPFPPRKRSCRIRCNFFNRDSRAAIDHRQRPHDNRIARASATLAIPCP